MPIKPIDFQVIVPVATEASRLASQQNQYNIRNRQQAEKSNIQQEEFEVRQVHKRNKTEEARIKEKQRDRNSNNKDNSKDKNKNNSKDNNKKNSKGNNLVLNFNEDNNLNIKDGISNLKKVYTKENSKNNSIIDIKI